MPWPLSQDYNEAVQHPRACFADAQLRAGEAAVNALGLPVPCSGNFADVYRLTRPGARRSWAVKCFTRQIPGLRQRYQQISRYLRQAKLPFVVAFRFLDRGIQVQGAWYPVIKMEWVEGLMLNEFVKSNLDNPRRLERLGRAWVRLAGRLRDANFAHCDLQHGNVMLVSGGKARALGVKLVDYDGLWVPTLARQKSGEVGHPSYQHPQRLREGTYSLEVDRFSHLVIYTAICSLALRGRPLWERYDNGDNLLFCQQDFQAPGSSPLFQELLELRDPQVRRLAGALAWAAQQPLERTPLLEEFADVERSASLVGSLADFDVPCSFDQKDGVRGGETDQQQRSHRQKVANDPVREHHGDHGAERAQQFAWDELQRERPSSPTQPTASLGLLACAIVFLLTVSVIGIFVMMMPRRDQSDTPAMTKPPTEKPRQVGEPGVAVWPDSNGGKPVLPVIPCEQMKEKAVKLKKGQKVIVTGRVKSLRTAGLNDDLFKVIPSGKEFATLSDDPDNKDRPEVYCVFTSGRPVNLQEGMPCRIEGVLSEEKTSTGIPILADCELVSDEARGDLRDAASETAMAAINRVCAQCHTGQRAKGDAIIFTSNGQFNKDAPWAAMKKAVEDGKMPPPKSPNKLTPEVATAIRTWIAG
jgi:serine/threonine protein kinase